jgi:hypothetical protein
MTLQANDKKIPVADPLALDFEIPSLFRRTLNLVLVPILNNLPHSALTFFTRSHRSAKEVVKHKTEHVALEVLYNHGSTFSSKGPLERLARWLWFGLDNPTAVRNRLKIVRRGIQAELSKRFEREEEVFVLSIASGSARAVLEAIGNTIEKFPHRKLHVVFLDKNPEATGYSKRLASEFGLFPHAQINMSWVTDTVGNYLSNTQHKDRFDIVEMVGLLDYFDDEKALNIFSKVLLLLKSDGIFICANIADNRERKFVTNFVGWKMIYRSAAQLRSLLIQSGFNEDAIQVCYEPLKIHAVTLARNVVS